MTLKEEYYDHILKDVDFGKSKNTVFEIVFDLSDRRGLRQGWEQIDDEIQEEILKTWIEIVTKN